MWADDAGERDDDISEDICDGDVIAGSQPVGQFVTGGFCRGGRAR